jgi:transposase
MFSYVSPEQRVPADHPLRPIRKMVDEILKEMFPQFAKLYPEVRRPSIAPERLLRSLLLQIFYSVRSERMLIEQLQYNLPFRRFVGMERDEAVWNHAVYGKNRERLLQEEIAERFFQRVTRRRRFGGGCVGARYVRAASALLFRRIAGAEEVVGLI